MLVSLVVARLDSSAQTNEINLSPTAQLEATNSREALLVLGQFEQQLRSNRLVLEQCSLEAREAAATNAQLLMRGLQSIENVLSAQQAAFSSRAEQEWNAVQNSNKALFVLLGIFVGASTLALFLICYAHWRVSRAWAGLASMLPNSRLLASASAASTLPPAGPNLPSDGALEYANRRLLGAVEKLERRIEKLEGRLRAAGDGHELTLARENGEVTPKAALSIGPASENDNPHIEELLAQGQSLLQANDPAAAIHCFDQVLSLDPNQSQALVKKGTALERLSKLNEAFECYDRAIAADASMTLAYLHKGGLCNRLERFKEALECYENALQSQEQQRG